MRRSMPSKGVKSWGVGAQVVLGVITSVEILVVVLVGESDMMVMLKCLAEVGDGGVWNNGGGGCRA